MIDTPVAVHHRSQACRTGRIARPPKERLAARFYASSLRHLLSTWPANSGKGFDQRGALDAKVAAHSRLGHAAIQRGDDGVQFLADDRRWPATESAPSLGGRQSGYYPFSGQGAFVLRKRTEHLKQ